MNIGKVRNQGWEFTLQTENFNTKNFRWTTDFNIAFNRNKVLPLSHNQESIVNVISYNNAYTPKSASRWACFTAISTKGLTNTTTSTTSTGKWVLKADIPDNGTGRSGVQPGDARFRDINGDGTVNADDCTIIGRGQPLHTGGFNNTFEFFGFDLNVFFQWNYGNDILNAARTQFVRGKSEVGYNRWKEYCGRWTPENPTSDIPARGRLGFLPVFDLRSGRRLVPAA